MKRSKPRSCLRWAGCGTAAVICLAGVHLIAAAESLAEPDIVLPLDRSAYFVGELVPIAIGGTPSSPPLVLEAVGDDGNRNGTVLLYQGPPMPLLLDTARLAPGGYQLRINGRPAGDGLQIVSPLRKSAGSMQDECVPREPQFHPQKQYTSAQRAAIAKQHWDEVVRTIRESGLSGVVAMAQSDMGRAKYLDALARAGAMLLVNSDTRPTSFFPVGNLPEERDGMSQRMLLTAHANGRFPNFAGFCFGWDTTGYAVGGRRGLMTYWGWGDKTQALRSYIDRLDRHTQAEFTRRTGLAPVSESEYIAYLLSIGRPEFAPAIDLPTKLWLEEIARHTRPLGDREREALELRLDAWSAYLMGMYREAYGALATNLRSASSSLRNTASVQVDHTAVRFGQYFPSAYGPLDLQYQSTWNDQVGGPDYAYQWLFTAGLLAMHRGERPTWLSNTFGAVHARAEIPGKFVRVAAHGLPWGVSGIGFACEGFSNLLGGMNADAAWEKIRGKAGEADVRAGRDFLDRFACLAVEGRDGEHGVGILFSRSQYQRQHLVMGFGTAPYQAFVALTRLGYTPRFVTEEELASERVGRIAALLVVGQTVPLPPPVLGAVERFRQAGGRVLIDGSTTAEIPRAEKLALRFSFTIPGKPHSWTSPNMVGADNDALLYARWHRELAPALLAALGDTGRGPLASEKGAAAQASLLGIDGGEAQYVIAVNDSHVRTQADWHQVRERLLPTGQAAKVSTACVYDCTEEKPLGRLGPIDCDLGQTTARVYAILPRPLDHIELTATQRLNAGGDAVVRVRFLDERGRPLAAVLPFHLVLSRPDGTPYQEFYRGTDREGEFSMAVPLGANVPAGTWSVEVRSQLSGEAASLPIQVDSGRPAAAAVPIRERVIVRQKAAIEQALTRGARIVLPVFDSPGADNRVATAEKVRAVLASRGVDVEIRRNPEITTYWLAYQLTEAQQRENARAERGETIGRIRRQTVNGNDWYSALSGYRVGRPVILLDLADQHGDNPLAEALDGQPRGSVGILWPQVSLTFPGPGRAMVQGVPWAFSPRQTAVVIQAADEEGLLAGAASLSELPADRLTPAIEAVRNELWQQHYVGGKPRRPKPENLAGASGFDGPLTASGLKTARRPSPFAIHFPGPRPVLADQVRPPEAPVRAATPLPAVFEPKQFQPLMRDGERFIEAGTAEMLYPDLRFSEAIQLVVDAKHPGKMRITAAGVFRYGDRKPCWQAQWEEIIELREKLVPRKRLPMEIEVRRDGAIVGRLVPVKTEPREVPLEMASASAGLKAKTVTEEVVVQLSGEIDLAAGPQRLVLVHHHIVDGKLRAVGVGVEP